jgi:Domain of unknown function (DUF5134)
VRLTTDAPEGGDVTAPGWLVDALAAMMLAVAAYCAGRPAVARIRRRTTDYPADIVHTAMGIAMAGMLTTRLAHGTAWLGFFAMAAGWFAVRVVAGWVAEPATAVATRSNARHLVSCAAMVYMLLATPAAAVAATPGVAMPAMGTAGGTRLPMLAVVLGVVMMGNTVTVMKQLPATTDGHPPGSLLAPRSMTCCRLAMTLTMGYLLLVMA